MTDRLKDLKIAFLATDMAEQVELTGPWEALKAAGAQPELVSIESGEKVIRRRGGDEFGRAFHPRPVRVRTGRGWNRLDGRSHP